MEFEAEFEFIELVGQVFSHPELDVTFILQGLCEILLEKMAKESSDESVGEVWVLLTKAQKLLKED
jgi:hypothetical protein